MPPLGWKKPPGSAAYRRKPSRSPARIKSAGVHMLDGSLAIHSQGARQRQREKISMQKKTLSRRRRPRVMTLA